MNEQKFTHGAMSPNDPSQVPMRYYSKEAAQAYANYMNSLIEYWEENALGHWNKDHWQVKPEPWVVKELK